MQTRGPFANLLQFGTTSGTDDSHAADASAQTKAPIPIVQAKPNLDDFSIPNAQDVARNMPAPQMQLGDFNQMEGTGPQGAIGESPVTPFSFAGATPEALLDASHGVPDLLEASGDVSSAQTTAFEVCAPHCTGGQVPRQCQTVCQKLASKGHCTPQCRWKCESQACDEVCEPMCQAPQCETRCKGIDVSGCQMDCQKPQCAVVCPRSPCSAGGCPSCKATCSEPKCQLRCNNTQPCHNVCEHPRCQWKCKAPKRCPAPKCHMVCESPPSCMGSTYKQLPALQSNEFSVRAFAAPGTGKFASKLMQVPMVTRSAGNMTGTNGDGLVTNMVSIKVR